MNMSKKKARTIRSLLIQFFEERGESFDRHDWGGCGCALDSAK